MQNPFQNTKASYFEDPDIIKYWVSPNKDDNDFFNTIMLPESSIPIRILGGKGSGKTHILRYFSYKSQIIRAENQNKKILNYIRDQGYIGVYLVSSGLNVNRFSGRGISEEHWKNIFYYYINLEFIERIIKKLIHIFEKSEDMDYSNKIDLTESLFHDVTSYNIYDLYALVKEQRVDIDNKINLLGFPGADTTCLNGIQPIFKIEDGFFDIVKKVFDSFDEIKSIKVLYIVDEFENFSEYQQIYFNTLLRHPKYVDDIAIRISGRLYAIKTNSTLDDQEKLLEDSEIKTIILENLLAKNFNEFAKKLYESRIRQSTNLEIKDIDFSKTFEVSKDANSKTVSEITEKNTQIDLRNRKYFKKLIKNIEDFYQAPKTIEIDRLLSNLSFDNALVEKINTFLCYKNWDEDLNELSEFIHHQIQNHDFKFQAVAMKHQIDLIYQLIREYQMQYYYGGFKHILYMSQNNPRIFLSILNNIFLETKLGNNINMFTDNVSCKIQSSALLETSIWFWNNFTEDVKDHRAVWAVKELCDFFRKVRQSTKPSEKTLVSFAYNPNEVHHDVNEIIDMAVKHSLLVESTQQRIDKNTAILKRQLKVHPMLAPKWELPVTVGGTITLHKNEIEALFCKNEEEWRNYFKIRLKRLDPPFEKDAKKHENSSEVTQEKSTNKKKQTYIDWE